MRDYKGNSGKRDKKEKRKKSTRRSEDGGTEKQTERQIVRNHLYP
jgi:hypothetical protein